MAAITPGRYRVSRWCCTSGMCMECRAVARGTARIRVVQISNLSKESAEAVARNFSSYEAKAEPMEE